MNLANKITLSRIPATFVFMVFLFWDGFKWHYTVALIVFALACLSDSVDGWVARRLKITTPFGIFFDPIADKILIGSAFVCFVGIGFFPAWIVVLLLAREFLVTGLRVVAADQKVVLTAEYGGKLKTFFHAFTINYFLVRLALQNEIPLIPHALTPEEIYGFGVTSLLLSLYTGAIYYFKNERLLNP